MCFSSAKGQELKNKLGKWFSQLSYVDGILAQPLDGAQPLGVNVVLEKDLEVAQALGDPRDQLVHPPQVLVFVGVQEVLELGVKDLQVLPDEDVVTGLEGAGFIFVRTILCPKRKMFSLLRAHSHVLTNTTRRHEYFRGD